MEPTAELRIDEVEFRTAFRGYACNEVDDFLEQVAAELAGLRAQLTQANQRAGADGADEPTVPASADDIVRSAHRTLLLAQRTADAAVKEAEEEAERLRSEAQAEAARAEADAASARQAAQAEAERLVEAARSEAARAEAEAADARQAAQAEVERVLEAARSEAARAEAEVGEVRRQAQAEADRSLDDARVEAERLVSEATTAADRRHQALDEELAQHADTTRLALVNEAAEIGRVRDALAADIEVLDRHLAARRVALRHTLDSVQRALDHPDSLRLPLPEGLSGILAPERPAGTVESGPSAEVVIDLTDADPRAGERSPAPKVDGSPPPMEPEWDPADAAMGSRPGGSADDQGDDDSAAAPSPVATATVGVDTGGRRRR